MQQNEKTNEQKAAAASAAWLSNQIAAIFDEALAEREADYIDDDSYERREREMLHKLALEEGMGR